MKMPSINRVKQYFEYDPASGEISTIARPRDEFSTNALWKRHIGRVGRPVGSPNQEGYVKVCMDGDYFSAHRIAWLIMTGEWPEYPEFEIDHINGDRADNRWENLRKVSKSENQRNGGQRINNSSGVHGVHWKSSKNRWEAKIWNGPKHVYLGLFKTIQEAAIARKAAERVLGFTGAERPPFKKDAK